MVSNGTGNKEDGFASIIIVLTLVIILGLMMLGFGKLMRNEQRSALDRQLSTQAFYAAESGVHDAIYALQNGFSGSTTGCNPALPGISSSAVGTSTGAKYTCLSVDTQPTNLEYGSLTSADSKYIIFMGEKLDRSGEAVVSAIKFSWQGTTSGSQTFRPAGTNDFPAQANWKNGTTNVDPGVLRISITPIANSFTSDTLRDNTYTVYLYPSAGVGTVSTSYIAGSANWNQQGQIINNACNSSNTPKQCNILITGLNSSRYIIRAKSIYATNDLMLTAYADNGATSPLRFVGAQALIDSTGKAQDVLRRIQVHVPVSTQYYMPEGALDAASSVCKLLLVAPGGASTDSCP